MSTAPELPEQWTVGCGALNGQKVCRVDEVRAYGQRCRAEALKDVSTELRAAIELDGFGCACEPRKQCNTCAARSVLLKVLTPMVKKFDDIRTAIAEGKPT